MENKKLLHPRKDERVYSRGTTLFLPKLTLAKAALRTLMPLTGHTGDTYYQFSTAAQGLLSVIPLREIFQPRISSLYGGNNILLPIIACI